MIYLIAAIIALPGIYFVMPYFARNLFRSKFLKKIEKGDCVCLTFDDGPNPQSTPEILSLLKKSNVRATFFLIGKKIETYPDLFHEIINQGHEVGDHGYEHVHAWTCLPFRGALDLFRGYSTLKKFSNLNQGVWLRPPYGKLNLITLCYLLVYGRKLAFWNVDPRDYLAQSPRFLSEKVLKEARQGAVILLHERWFHSNRSLEGNLQAIETIIQDFKYQGRPLVTLSEAVLGYNSDNNFDESSEHVEEKYSTGCKTR